MHAGNGGCMSTESKATSVESGESRDEDTTLGFTESAFDRDKQCRSVHSTDVGFSPNRQKDRLNLETSVGSRKSTQAIGVHAFSVPN